MQTTRRFAGASYALFIVAFLWAPIGMVQSGPKPKKFLTGPLVIGDQGSFFIGGVPKVTEYAVAPAVSGTAPAQLAAPAMHQITLGQMYVQFQIPAKRNRVGWPVIMVHGASHTGACLESTPDGREGWYPDFVRKGVPTYVVDQAGRGRSGFDNSVLHEAEAKISSGDLKAAAELIPSFGRITDDRAWILFFGHLVLKGLITIEGSCSLQNSGLTAADFDNIPYLAFKGDYATKIRGGCQEAVDAINARRALKLRAAKAEYLKLVEMGMLGVTHMMMLDKRNLEIADIILNWIKRNVRETDKRR